MSNNSLQTNISNDLADDELIAAMANLSNEPDPIVTPTGRGVITHTVVTPTVVKPQSVADSYIRELRGWSDSSNYSAKSGSNHDQFDSDDIIDITPQNISSIGSKLMLGSKGVHQYTPERTQHTFQYHDSEDYETIHSPRGYEEIHCEPSDVGEKVDAIYNKLCSVEQTDSDLVEGFTHVNDYLDSLSKDLIKLKIDTANSTSSMRAQVNNLQLQVEDVKTTVGSLGTKLDTVLFELATISRTLAQQRYRLE